MTANGPDENMVRDNETYFERAKTAFERLFQAAKGQDEVQFALSLAPESRGEQDPGWNTAEEAQVAFDEYLAFLKEGKLTRLKKRIAIAFYCHISEAAGFYEIPKNLLRVAGGEHHVLWPFQHLVELHRRTGNVMAPNANAVIRDLVGHAESIGYHELAEVLRDAFDPELRNSYTHADYIIWIDGIRLRNRNGRHPRLMTWAEFQNKFNRGINFFHILRETVRSHVEQYDPAKTVLGSTGPGPKREWTISYSKQTGQFWISGSSS